MTFIKETPYIWSESTNIVSQMQSILTIDDDEIYNDIQPSQEINRIQYINSVRKTRPLPKIPERSSSKELNDNKNKLTARQLFEMLSDDRITDNIEEDEVYGGVYALKTQLPSPQLSHKLISSYQYDNFNTNQYKMMTPVQEVEEDQLYDQEEENDDRPSLSEISFNNTNTPSLTSGRTSPSSSSHQSQKSVDSIKQKDEFAISQYQMQDEEDVSLISDVKRLSELNQALMTPVISNRIIEPNMTTTIVNPYELNTEDYTKTNTASPQAMTSFSLTNDKESIKTYRRMATKTHDKNIQFTYAKYLMQLVSFHGTDQTRDRLQEEVEYWIEKLSKSNHADALYIKGQWHSHCCDKSLTHLFIGSQYKKVNYPKAFKCFQQAAKLGSTEAQYELAECWKDRQEYKKAVINYKFAASKNHILALYKLANILLRGLMNQEKDAYHGLIFLKKAADSNKPESARSAYDLACIYSQDFDSIDLNTNGLKLPSTTPETYNLAIEYYKKADNFGLVLATYRLGYIYEHGHLNTPIDLQQAFKYYLKAAEMKHEVAMLEVSKFYKQGIPDFLNPEHTIAHEWCTRATENGNEIAEFTLGIYFEYGIGVHPDHVQALKWYQKAASKGYSPAKDKLSNRPNQVKFNIKTHNRKKYYEESVRMAEKSRRVHAEQNCQIM